MNKAKLLNSKFSIGTLYSPTNYIRRTKYFQHYNHRCGFYMLFYSTEIYRDHIGYTLAYFISNCGIPEHLIFNELLVKTGSKNIFNGLIYTHGIYHYFSVR